MLRIMTSATPAPQRQRVAAYAVIIRDDRILLSRLAAAIAPEERWTLPGGGLEFGENPRDAVVREVREETGIDVQVADRAWVDSIRRRVVLPPGSGDLADLHSIRLVFEGWAPVGAPEPRVVEIDGSTMDARWVPLDQVYDGSWPVVAWVRQALAEHRPVQVQRLAAKALALRDGAVLLARLGPTAVGPGRWTLPGGGVDHGEPPATALAREMLEETGLPAEVGELLGVHDVHFSGTAPNGRHEDFHAVNLVFAVTVPGDVEPRVVEVDGTTDAVAWIDLADIAAGAVEVTGVVTFGLGLG